MGTRRKFRREGQAIKANKGENGPPHREKVRKGPTKRKEAPIRKKVANIYPSPQNNRVPPPHHIIIRTRHFSDRQLGGGGGGGGGWQNHFPPGKISLVQ